MEIGMGSFVGFLGTGMDALICLNLSFRKVFGPKIQHIFDPISIILPQTDFIKDMILVTRLITLLGGIVVFTKPQMFSSNVSKPIEA